VGPILEGFGSEASIADSTANARFSSTRGEAFSEHSQSNPRSAMAFLSSGRARISSVSKRSELLAEGLATCRSKAGNPGRLWDRSRRFHVEY